MLEKKHQGNYHCSYGYEMNSKIEVSVCLCMCFFPLLQLYTYSYLLLNFILEVLINFHHQIDWIQNPLRDIPQGVFYEDVFEEI